MGVEREEADAGGGTECVVPPAVHVEQRVVPLFRRVIVAKRGPKGHPGRQQTLVRRLELLLEVTRTLAAKDVAAYQHYQIELEPLAKARHLIGDLVLGPIPGAGVAGNEELQRSGLVRKGGERLDENQCEGEQQRAHAASSPSI